MNDTSILFACFALEILCIRELITCIKNAILKKKCTQKILCKVIKKENVKVYSRGSKNYRFANLYTYKNQNTQETYGIVSTMFVLTIP